jgi:hypothetical protein
MPNLLRAVLVPMSLVLLLSLSDCIRFGTSLIPDSDTTEAEPTPTPFATPWPTPTPRIPATPTPEPTPTPEASMTQDDLSEFLISIDELPNTWQVVDIDNPISAVPGVDSSEVVLVSEFFQRSELGPYMVHMLLFSESEAEAEEAFEAIQEELDAAEILEEVTSQVRSWETELVDFDEFGDETFAFRAIGDTGLIPVEADMVAVRQGQYISFIIYAELMEVDSDNTEALVEAAVERLPED